MVHRPVDSRLLTNVLSQEKEYSKQLNSLLDQSHASVASYSAYASASSPPTSNVILAVATSLASADEALRRYAAAVEECSAHLKGLKELEDQVGNILRDREILVTRLIKASKTSKPTAANRLSFTLHSTSSLTSLQSSGSSPLPLPGAYPPSSSSFSSTSPAPSPLHTSQKLSAAQSELQACEAHLALKERELATMRAGAFRDGMSVRFRALVECGWVWGEMGKEALRVLDELGAVMNGGIQQHQTGGSLLLSQPPTTTTTTTTYTNGTVKPLPDISSRPSSDLSSLAPSQSASQIEPSGATSSNYSNSQQGHGVSSVSDHTGAGTGMAIPPAHAITDSSGHFYPYAPGPSSSTITAASAPAGSEAATSPQRHVLQHRITEEELATMASIDEHGHGHIEDSTPQPPPPPIPEKSAPQRAENPPRPQADEEEDGALITNDDSSSINEPTPPPESLQVVENPRFATPVNGSKISLNRSQKPPPLPTTQSPAKDKSATYAPLGSPHKPHRRFTLATQNRRESYDSRNSDTTAPQKAGFFGSLGRSLFGGKKKDKEKEGGSEVSTSKPGDVPPVSPSKPIINLNSSPSASRIPQGGRIYAAEDSSDDDSDGGEDEHQRGRKGLRGLFSHSNGSGAGAGGGSKKWDTRTDKNLNALQKGGRGHRRAGSVDQVNLVHTNTSRGANPNLYDVVAGAGLPNSTSNPSKTSSIPSGTHRKRVASDVGYRTPPRLDSQALLGGGGSPTASGSPTTPTSPGGRPGMKRSPSDSSAGAKSTGRKLKKRSPSSNAAQVPTLATIQSGKSEEGHGEPSVAVAGPIHSQVSPQQTRPQPQQPHVMITAPTPPSTGEKGKSKVREPGVGGSDVGTGGGAVKRTKSTRNTGAASGKRSSSVPPTMSSSASASTVTITPVKSTKATSTPVSNVPNQIMTHHAGGAVLVTGMPSATAGTGTGVGGGANLSRNSSLMSAMSAPPLLLVPAPGSVTAAAQGGATKRGASTTRHGYGHHGGSGSALGVAGERTVPAGPRPVSQGHVKRSASVNVPSTTTTTTSQQHHHLQQQLRQQHAQPFIIPTAPPPASAAVGILPPSKPVSGPLSTGVEVKAPRRVDREELEREVATGSSVSASGQHHHHHHVGSPSGGVTRGRSLERVADGEATRSQRQQVPPPHQQPGAKKQTPIEVPSAPKSIFESETPAAAPSGSQNHQQELHLATPAPVPGSSRISEGSSTPLAVAAPQPRPAASTSSPVFPPVPIVQPTPSQPVGASSHHQFGNTLSPSPSLHRQHDKSPLRSALKNSTSGSASGNSRSPSPEKVPSHRSQSPLKSALKNPSTTNVHLVVGQGAGPSRTPSPLAFGSSAGPPEPTRSPPPTNTVATSPATVPIPSPAATSSIPVDDDRRMSIASATTDDDAEYETADEDEDLSDTEDPTESTPTHTSAQLPAAAIPPPPTQAAVPNGHAVQPPPGAMSAQTSEGSAVGPIDASAAGGGQVKRRKSVRVSLQPTFTPTPPAIEYSDEEEEAEVRAPWGGRDRKAGREDEQGGAGGEPKKEAKSKGKKKDTKELPTPDMWEDSSEEDVEYSRARKLLSRLGKKKDHR